MDEGDEQWGGQITVDRDEMLAFAHENDPWPFHVDEDIAKESVFGNLVASGGYTISFWFKLGHQLLNDFAEILGFNGRK